MVFPSCEYPDISLFYSAKTQSLEAPVQAHISMHKFINFYTTQKKLTKLILLFAVR